VGVFSYAGMPWPEAERNMRLFAREVMPALQKLGPAPGAVLSPAAPVSGAIDVGLLAT